MSSVSRRAALGSVVASAAALSLNSASASQIPASAPAKRRTRIGVSTYSFWQFRNKDLRSIETCIDLASEWGFDGVEILEMQMTDTSNSALQKLKQRAFVNGLDLCGFSTHQGWVSPDKQKRKLYKLFE